MTEVVTFETRPAEQAPGAIDELAVMLDAATAFAAKFGSEPQSTQAWKDIAANPQPDHMPASCCWLSTRDPATSLRRDRWFKKPEADSTGSVQ